MTASARARFNAPEAARDFHQLMLDLGYSTYVAQVCVCAYVRAHRAGVCVRTPRRAGCVY
jgi:hypothetical protein